MTDRFMIARHNRWRFEQEWIRLLLYASGNQWVQWDRGRRQWKARPVPSWFHKAQTNKFTPLGEHNVASILQQTPNVHWYPLPDQPADLESSDAANRINRLIEVETERTRNAHVRARWQVFTGEAFVESAWDASPKWGTEFVPFARCMDCLSEATPTELEETGGACPQCGSPNMDESRDIEGCQCPLTGEQYGPEQVGMPTPAATLETQDESGQIIQTPHPEAPPLMPMFGQQPRGMNIPKGRLRSYIRSGFEVYYDPAIREFSEQGGLRWCSVIESISMDVAREHYGDEACDCAPQGGSGLTDQAQVYLSTLSVLTNSYLSFGNDFENMSISRGHSGERLLRETYYQLPDKRYPEGVMAVRLGGADGKMVEHKPLPYHDTTGRTFIPVVHYPFQRQAGRVAGRTPMSDIARLQELRNKAEAAMVLSERRMANGAWLIPDTGGTKSKPTGEPGEHIYYKALNAGMGRAPKPERLEPQNPASYYQYRIAALDQAMEELAGNFDVQSGRAPDGVRAASAIAMLAEKQQMSIAPQIRLTELSDEELARQQMFIFREYGFADHISPLPGDDNQWTLEKYSNADLTGKFDCKVEAGSAMPKSNAQMRATIEGLHNMQLIDITNPNTIRRIHMEFGTRKLIPGVEVDLRDAQREGDRFMDLARGGKTARFPLFRPMIDNHQAHIAEHVTLAKTDEFLEMEQRAQDGDIGAQMLVASWYDHINMHQQHMAMQMAEAAMAQSGGEKDKGGRPEGSGGNAFPRQEDEGEITTREVLQPKVGIG